ncbi:piRNA biogenesis protein EXD1-like [Biomphalaria glabrata]|uniref:PiRNA biogenesis protein EXD1-like n=1 Tax=Biomphalaria glabrata TaxID=6526 RepID=A0A9W3B0N7_BIOGL|nr:piRNA biogenesis protein EXD1-like [Biomphalaria glabrata]KAI8746528.1 exonuclease 3-5 domain-containing protein 1 [Biomphalaria glabrata]
MAELCDSRPVILTVGNGTKFHGILHAFDVHTGKIVLKNVKTDGAKLLGPIHMYLSDLIDFQYVDTNDDGTVSFSKQNLLFLKCTKSCAKTSQADVMSQNSLNWSTDSDADDSKPSTLKENVQLIDTISDAYFQGLKHINSQTVIGVTVDGNNIGRLGTLSLIEIATDTKIYIFDMLVMKSEAFDAGLREIFENENIKKIIHDCRFIADMLRHQYSTEMKNVFDTQVAKAFTVKSVGLSRYVQNLTNCLRGQLCLTDDQVFKVQDYEYKDYEKLILERPLSDKLLNDVSTNVGHMIRLYRVLLEKMLDEYTTAVDIYMNYIDYMEGDVDKCRRFGHLFPEIFGELNKWLYQAKSSLKQKDLLCRKSQTRESAESSETVLGDSSGSSSCKDCQDSATDVVSEVVIDSVISPDMVELNETSSNRPDVLHMNVTLSSQQKRPDVLDLGMTQTSQQDASHEDTTSSSNSLGVHDLEGTPSSQDSLDLHISEETPCSNNTTSDALVLEDTASQQSRHPDMILDLE